MKCCIFLNMKCCIHLQTLIDSNHHSTVFVIFKVLIFFLFCFVLINKYLNSQFADSENDTLTLKTIQKLNPNHIQLTWTSIIRLKINQISLRKSSPRTSTIVWTSWIALSSNFKWEMWDSLSQSFPLSSLQEREVGNPSA